MRVTEEWACVWVLLLRDSMLVSMGMDVSSDVVTACTLEGLVLQAALTRGVMTSAFHARAHYIIIRSLSLQYVCCIFSYSVIHYRHGI